MSHEPTTAAHPTEADILTEEARDPSGNPQLGKALAQNGQPERTGAEIVEQTERRNHSDGQQLIRQAHLALIVLHELFGTLAVDQIGALALDVAGSQRHSGPTDGFFPFKLSFRPEAVAGQLDAFPGTVALYGF